MKFLLEDNFTDDDPEPWDPPSYGSTGWVVVSFGMASKGVVLDYDSRLGLLGGAIDVVGGDCAEELGINVEGDPGTYRLWVAARVWEHDLEFDVVEVEEIWTQGCEPEGLSRRVCTHQVRIPTDPPLRTFVGSSDLVPPGWECVTCGQRRSGKTVDHLRRLILQRHEQRCGFCGDLYPESKIVGKASRRGKEHPICYACKQRREHGILNLEILTGRPFDWSEGAAASEHVVGDDGEVNWRAAFAADPGVVSCPVCYVYHWREGEQVACAACGHEWSLLESPTPKENA